MSQENGKRKKLPAASRDAVKVRVIVAKPATHARFPNKAGKKQVLMPILAKGAPHRIALLVPKNVIAFDLSIAFEVFDRTRLADGSAAYEVSVCSEARVVRTRAFDLHMHANFEAAIAADTVIVPGIEDIDAPISPALHGILVDAVARKARVASICTGAFVLAAAGLLDGRRATTHWVAATRLATRYPSITVDPDVLYVDEGQIVTSAGAAAGLDMCLHLVQRDYGAAVAAATARLAVAPLAREGGQAQYISHPPLHSATTLKPLLDWAEKHPTGDLTIEVLAERAAMSPRTFCRRFKEQVGTSPGLWVQRLRTRRAQMLLEETDLSIEEIALKSGFDSSSSFRERFRQKLKCSPVAYRRSFRNNDAAPRRLWSGSETSDMATRS